jgi:hypothetical protein
VYMLHVPREVKTGCLCLQYRPFILNSGERVDDGQERA